MTSFARVRELLTAASLEIDGQTVRGSVGDWQEPTSRRLTNGVIEQSCIAPLAAMPQVTFTLTLQQPENDASAPVRFCFRIHSASPRRLTKSGGQDHVVYLGLPVPPAARMEEIHLSEFVELTHTYTPAWTDVSQRLRDGLSVMGPILLVHTGNGQPTHLLAYEHGSQEPDAFLKFDCVDGKVRLRGVKANYLTDQRLDAGEGFTSPWFHFMDAYEPARYRRFLLEHQSPNTESRKPYLFYNTWNYQERIQGWHGKKYLDEMHQDRMTREIDVAAKLGIDVFVIDTGWYEKTGDWRVNRQRFPDGLASIKRQLDSHGMRLGLWFDNAAAVSSAMLANHRDCVQCVGPEAPKPYPIWETEESQRLCPVSRWWQAYADEMIRLHGEVGVTYFKLDAISQRNAWNGWDDHYNCDAETHDHGDASHTPAERGARFAYLLPLYMAKIADRVREQVPSAIVDFDMTEGGRCLGLSFLSASKFFLINNGPYYHNYQVPAPKDRNINLFFYPGPARNALCRTTAAYDRVLPLTTMLTHYFPDGPAEYQLDSLASLMLGHGGIWGDLCALSDEEIARIGQWTRQFKRVRDDVARAYPVQTGTPSASPEIHEKLHTNGRGLVALFAQAPGRYEYVTRNPAAREFTAMDGVTIRYRPDGRAHLTVDLLRGQTARVVFFG